MMTEMPRVLSLSEAAERLNMKRSNVAKFLVRRDVSPALVKAQGYFWWEADIERVKAEREADKVRMAADEKRRRAALRGREANHKPVPPELSRLGARQRSMLAALLRHPIVPDDDAARLALRRLQHRGLADTLQHDRRVYQLTEAGRKAASQL